MAELKNLRDEDGNHIFFQVQDRWYWARKGCVYCYGTGLLDDEETDCSRCHGTGKVPVTSEELAQALKGGTV